MDITKIKNSYHYFAEEMREFVDDWQEMTWTKDDQETLDKMVKELDDLKTTIRIFLYDLDGSETDESMPKVLMTNGMWLQVEAFRRLV